MFGANVITVPAKKHGHDLPAMLKAITPQTQVVFVANPNNPTGTLAPREEVIEFVNDVPDAVLLVMDEAYIEFLDEPLDLVPLGDSARRETQSDAHADLFEDFWAGRLAARLWHRPSRIDRRARKNPATLQHQFHSRRPARWLRWTTPSTCARRARTMRR